MGFYASFMVADHVSVESASALLSNQDHAGHKWSSEGLGVFDVEPLSSASSPASSAAPSVLPVHGTRITLRLKDSCKEFADPERIRSIIKRYSSFVSFPIKLNGEATNTVSALWSQAPASVTAQAYTAFYKFLTNDYDSFLYKLHYTADAPIELKCLLYIPSAHSEKFGLGRMEPAVNLYRYSALATRQKLATCQARIC